MLALVTEYLDLPVDSPARRALERKFGAAVIMKHVQAYEEEKSTRDWLQNSTTKCPGCHVHVEKSLGCNHVCDLLHYLEHANGLMVIADEVCEMSSAFLLPLRYKAQCTEAVRPFFISGLTLPWQTL